MKNEFSKEHFLKQYRYTTTIDLLHILEHHEHYATDAIEAIKDIIAERGVTHEDASYFEQSKIVLEDKLFRRANFEDITVLQKIYFYLLPLIPLVWLPFYVKEWKQYGYLLRIKRAYYFCSMSLVLYIGSLILDNYISYSIFGITITITTIFLDWQAYRKRKKRFDEIYGNDPPEKEYH